MQILNTNKLDTTAIQLGEVSITYAMLQDKANHLARKLQALPKGILVLEAAADITFVMQLLSALQAKQPIALFPPLLSAEEKKTRLNLLGPSFTIDEEGTLDSSNTTNQFAHHPQLALILFTSGSTGKVKAVQLSAANILANCRAVSTALEFNLINSQLLFLPLSYSFGLLGQLLPGLLNGITTHLLPQFTAIKSLLETGSIPQMWSGVPSHWVAICKMAGLFPESAQQIKAIVSAGAPLTTILRAQLQQTFPNATVFNNYGLTEASPRVLTYSSKDPLFMDNYAGYPVGDWEIKQSADGELLIRGSQVMLGYLGETHEGWLATGDIVDVLPNGLIAIKGRRDNVVNISGEKVNLNEVEQTLSRMEEIGELLIVPIPDTLYGVRLMAYVEHANLGLSAQQLTEKIQQHLLPRKLPITACLTTLPRNPHGKLDRKALMADLNRATPQGIPA